MSDFLSLMIAQLTNQDFTNPVNDTEYVAQMAQFSTLSAMQELSQLSRQSYVLSLLGKNCTVSENLIGGDVKTVTGKVTSISLVDDDYKVTINGKQYGMSEITSVSEATEEK
jgi:flagellar hook assembly protein FlgD